MPATFTATIEKTFSGPKMGVYVPTSIDARKAAADILIQNCGSSASTVFARKAIRGRGISPVNVDALGIGLYSATDAALDKLRGSYRIECDF